MTKKIQLVFLTLVFFILLAVNVCASLTINIETKPEFTIGETVSFKYTFLSDTDVEIKYLAVVDCPNAPLPLLGIISANLEKNIPFVEEYIGFEVRDDIKPQKCRAVVGIIEPFEISKEEYFDIIINRSFEFWLILCKDQSCSERSKVFVQNSNIYIDYNSEIENPLITAILTLPDKSTKQIILPTSIKVGQIGTYTLEVTASKEDYKTITMREQFGVIKKEAGIEFVNIYDKGEKNQSYPQESYLFNKKIDKIGIILIFVVILISLIIVFIIFVLIKRKEKPGSKIHSSQKSKKPTKITSNFS